MADPTQYSHVPDPAVIDLYAAIYKLSPRTDKIKYLDTSVKPFTPNIPLVEYFERVKRHRADRWQKDFCERLQEAAVTRGVKARRASIHAEGQLGKSVILAQCYPAWILGHDPLAQIALATYNVTRSQSHSRAVMAILNSPAHASVFPDSDSRPTPVASMAGWQTVARGGLGTGEAQFSFNPVGLQSGLTGAKFDYLLIDDPYADQNEAFSETTRRNLTNFWEYTVLSRIQPSSCVFGMFHRYHYQDLAGYLLEKAGFDYWRYATVADGDFVDKATGRVFPDPLGRQLGEYISPERRPPEFYNEIRRNTRVWSSMFQGRPAPDSGDFFQTDRISIVGEGTEIERALADSVAVVRAWDNAAVEGGGDWTVGVKMGIDAGGRVGIYDAVRAQYATETRLQLQKRMAAIDGHRVVVSIPRDPASAGKDVVFFTRREMAGYTVAERPTTGKKAVRAMPFADAVRDGRVWMAQGEWNAWVLDAFQQFGFSDFDHPVDAAADGFNFLTENAGRGLILSDFNQGLHATDRREFFLKYGDRLTEFNIYGAISIRSDGSLPNAGVIIGIPPERENLGNTMILLSEYCQSGVSELNLFEWLSAAKSLFGMGLVYMDASTKESFGQVIWQKLGLQIGEAFATGKTDGIAELVWYLRQGKDKIARRRFLVTGNDADFPAFYREVSSWGHDAKGDPTMDAPVCGCLRILAAHFHAQGQELSEKEKIEAALPEGLRRESVEAILNSNDIGVEYDNLLRARLNAIQVIQKESKSGSSKVYGKPVFGSRYRR